MPGLSTTATDIALALCLVVLTPVVILALGAPVVLLVRLVIELAT
jgi:hypothetical protein